LPDRAHAAKHPLTDTVYLGRQGDRAAFFRVTADGSSVRLTKWGEKLDLQSGYEDRPLLVPAADSFVARDAQSWFSVRLSETDQDLRRFGGWCDAIQGVVGDRVLLDNIWSQCANENGEDGLRAFRVDGSDASAPVDLEGGWPSVIPELQLLVLDRADGVFVTMPSLWGADPSPRHANPRQLIPATQWLDRSLYDRSTRNLVRPGGNSAATMVARVDPGDTTAPWIAYAALDSAKRTGPFSSPAALAIGGLIFEHTADGRFPVYREDGTTRGRPILPDWHVGDGVRLAVVDGHPVAEGETWACVGARDDASPVACASHLPDHWHALEISPDGGRVLLSGEALSGAREHLSVLTLRGQPEVRRITPEGVIGNGQWVSSDLIAYLVQHPDRRSAKLEVARPDGSFAGGFHPVNGMATAPLYQGRAIPETGTLVLLRSAPHGEVPVIVSFDAEDPGKVKVSEFAPAPDVEASSYLFLE
jgi:hypothetical protein